MAWRLRFRSSVRYKLALLMLAVVSAALLVAGTALAAYELNNFRRQAQIDLNTQAEILGRASAAALAFDDRLALQENLQLMKNRPAMLAGAIFDPRGRVLVEYRAPRSEGFSFPSLDAAEVEPPRDGRMSLVKRVVENGEIVGSVYLVRSYPVRERLLDYVGILGAVMTLSLVVAGLLSLWLQKRLTQPILAISAAAHQVMERRDFSLRVPKSTEDEIGYLVDAFNGMLAELGRRDAELQASRVELEQEVSERRRVDEELRALNIELEQRVAQRTQQLEAANKEMESFSYSVSHDLRTPLRGVVGFTDALIEDHGDELCVEAKRKLGIVHAEGLRMGRLIDDLLSFSRLGRKALQPVEVDMEALVRSSWATVSQLAQGREPELQLGRLPKAQADPALIAQVWINLLSNAVKFSAKREQAVVQVSAITDAREHIYFVRDNGAGFNPKYQDKLFGVFQRLHDSSEFGGTGVGLALVQRIVTRHGGRVWAEGQPNQGATFYFSLPKEGTDEPL